MPKMISIPEVHLEQSVHLSCAEIGYLQTDRNALPLHPRHVGVPSVAPKMISERFVRSAQTVHLSCAKTNRTSKWTEMSYQMTHDT